MRIERVDRNRVKITLSDLDFDEFAVNKRQLAMNKDVLRGFILKLMDAIHEETDFNPYTGNIMIEAKEHEDGMSIIVSKLPYVKKYTKDELKNAGHINAVIKKKELKKDGINPEIYCFDSFEDLCSAISMIEDYAHSGNSLYNYNGTYYYLAVIGERFKECGDMLCRMLSTLSEYSGRGGNNVVSSAHIKEHGKLIAEGDALISMASGIRDLSKNCADVACKN